MVLSNNRRAFITSRLRIPFSIEPHRNLNRTAFAQDSNLYDVWKIRQQPRRTTHTLLRSPISCHRVRYVDAHFHIESQMNPHSGTERFIDFTNRPCLRPHRRVEYLCAWQALIYNNLVPHLISFLKVSRFTIPSFRRSPAGTNLGAKHRNVYYICLLPMIARRFSRVIGHDEGKIRRSIR